MVKMAEIFENLTCHYLSLQTIKHQK